MTGKRIGSARIKFLFADIKTGVEKRDADMRRWEQTGQFPDCVYILDALLPAAGGTFNARGRFILHGVTQTVSIPVTIGYTSNDTCMIDGDLSLNTSDFGLPPIHQFLVYKVGPTLQVKFHLEGQATPDS
jgi:polyisoprenoid-binding protein YceI